MSNRLPCIENAHIDREKVTGYLLCLDRLPAAAKARFFTAFGFRSDQWETLRDALLRHAHANPVMGTTDSAYGTKHVVEGPLECPDGRQPKVCAVWQIDKGSLAPRLITAYPAEQ